MNSELSAVMQRRGDLLAKTALQREHLAEIGARLQTPLAWAARGLAVARFLRSNPVLVAGVTAALVIRRRSVVGIARVARQVWKGCRSFARITSKLSQ